MDNRTYDGSKIIVEYAGQRRERRKGPKSDDVCFNCHKPGHWYSIFRATDCKEEDCRGKCFKCGNPGHIKRECKASRSRSPRKESVTKSPEKSVSSEKKSEEEQY